MGSWEPEKGMTYIYGKEFYLTKDVVVPAFRLVKGAPSKIDTRIFKQGLTFKGSRGSPRALRSCEHSARTLSSWQFWSSYQSC